MKKYQLSGFIIFFLFNSILSRSQTTNVKIESKSETEYITINGEEALINSKYKSLILAVNEDSLIKSDKYNSDFWNTLQKQDTFKRRIAKRVNLSSVTRSKPYELTFKICVDQSGEMIYSKLQFVKGIDEKQFIHTCQELLFNCKFTPQNTNPIFECGNYNIKISGIQYH